MEERQEAIELAESSGDPHLRSAMDVRGHRLRASDGEVGHVEDFLIDDDLRRILFLAVNLEEWLSGRQVLIPPRLISRIDWVSFRVEVDLPSRVITAGQEYKPAA
jgi:hypothetical protein